MTELDTNFELRRGDVTFSCIYKLEELPVYWRTRVSDLTRPLLSCSRFPQATFGLWLKHFVDFYEARPPRTICIAGLAETTDRKPGAADAHLCLRCPHLCNATTSIAMFQGCSSAAVRLHHLLAVPTRPEMCTSPSCLSPDRARPSLRQQE